MSDINEFALRGIRAEIERLQTLEQQLQQSARKGGQISVTTSDRKGGQMPLGRGGTVFGSGRTGGGAAEYMATVPQKRKRKLSAAGRKAISDAAKARWARQKGDKGVDGAAGAKSAGGGKKR